MDDNYSFVGDDSVQSTISSRSGQQQQQQQKQRNQQRRKDSSGSLYQKFAQYESDEVRRIKYIVLLAFVIIGVTVSTLSYSVVSMQHSNYVNTTYEESVFFIKNSMKERVHFLFEANRALSRSITSDALVQASSSSSFSSSSSTGTIFPFYSIPFFETYAYNARTRGLLDFITYAPYCVQDQMDQFINFSLSSSNLDWIQRSRQLYTILENNKNQSATTISSDSPDSVSMVVPNKILDVEWNNNMDGNLTMQFHPMSKTNTDTLFIPTLHHSPPPTDKSTIPVQNVNLLSMIPNLDKSIQASVTLNEMILSNVNSTLFQTIIDSYLGYPTTEDTNNTDLLYSFSIQPVYTNLKKDRTETISIGGFLLSMFTWDAFIRQIILSASSSDKSIDGIYLVITNSCQQNFTYIISDDKPTYVGDGDLPKEVYAETLHSFNFAENYYNQNISQHLDGICFYSVDLYSSVSFDANVDTNNAAKSAIIVGVLFSVVIILFLLYDKMVERRARKFADAAARSNDIISSLYPSNIRDRLLKDKEQQEKRERSNNGSLGSCNDIPGSGSFQAPPPSLQSYFDSGAKKKLQETTAATPNTTGLPARTICSEESSVDKIWDTNAVPSKFIGAPIADLIPETSVFFGDIVGFTSWSSVREPTQVFMLLESLYNAFDVIAKRQCIFKVETVGDCYVAASGIPDQRKDHAVIMCWFAREAMEKTWELTKQLETMLGPGTGDLTMRMGVHSGPVTAGVLRGERSRFQLFGDTVNTAALMESTGEPDKIQISAETSTLLVEAGKESWFHSRGNLIHLKGSREVQTYWLKVGNRSLDGRESSTYDSFTVNSNVRKKNFSSSGPFSQSLTEDNDSNSKMGYDQCTRLLDWSFDILSRFLKQIIARRSYTQRFNHIEMVDFELLQITEKDYLESHAHTILEEVKEIIELPLFDSSIPEKEIYAAAPALKPIVEEQLRQYLKNIAASYHSNAFHNFEHASHVTMSVVKLLSRIVAPSDNDKRGVSCINALSLHDHTYGITSDPLTQFTCVLSALIHDLDHQGVPNAQLVKEESALASVYKNKSVAEQNSVSIAWRMLMEPSYSDLRACIYTNESELSRFRQLLVNSVMATDIVDKELKALRNSRWEKAFSQEESNRLQNERDQKNRKATIVIGHLIQASDVAHTMQHWHVYRKWNERFFIECYQSYMVGRTDVDPSITWYEGEIGFFDFYIIPLAKKLKECGVFGVSSDEYLNYATKNRQEWEERGKEIVMEMVERSNKSFKKEDG